MEILQQYKQHVTFDGDRSPEHFKNYQSLPYFNNNFSSPQCLDTNANYPTNYSDSSCEYRSSGSIYSPGASSPYTFNFPSTTSSLYSSVDSQSQPSLVDPKFPSETFDIPDIRDQGVEFTCNNPGFPANHLTGQCVSRFRGFQPPAQYLTSHHRVGSLVRYGSMEVPSNVTTPMSSEDSDDSMPLSLFAGKKAPSPKLTKKGKEKKPRKRKKKDPNEPQKPVSAYALFFRDTQAAIKGQKPNASFGEVSKIVASMWDSLDADSKDTYKKRTETAKKEYLKKLAAYRASVISQQTPDQAFNDSTEINSDMLEEGEVIMPASKKSKKEPSVIVISSSTEDDTRSSPAKAHPAVLPTTITTVNQQLGGSVSWDAKVAAASASQTQTSTSLKGQTIQIPRSLLEQAANKPFSITVTQAGGDTGTQTKVIKVMLPEKELQKIREMRHVPTVTTTAPQVVPQVTSLIATQVNTHVSPEPVAEITPIVSQDGTAPSTASQPNDVAVDQEKTALQEPATMAITEEVNQPIPICEYTACSNQAIQSPLWDNEYCSSQCVVNHCQDVFTAWVAARSGTY